MIKKFLFKAVPAVLIIALALFGCKSGTDDKIAARVNGEKIYYSQVTRRVLICNIFNEVYFRQYSKIFSDPEECEEKIKKMSKPTEYGDVLNDLIKVKVICQYNKKEGILLKSKDTNDAVDINFDLMKDRDSSEGYYSDYIEVAESYGLNETMLLDLIYEYEYYEYNQRNCKSRFFDMTNYHPSEEDADARFEEFVNDLIGEAKITIEE
ncbi:MAG: hypothetical protein ACI4QV_02015 [Acutalibacteraceae bacterium]